MKNTQGSYIYGNPSQGGPQSLWGKPVEQTKAIPAANALTGDFEMYSELYLSGDMNVEIGYVNDDFIKNRRVALAEMFALLLIKRASAFSNTQNLTVGSGSVTA
jgi:HK97 family phage major capsid protein